MLIKNSFTLLIVKSLPCKGSIGVRESQDVYCVNVFLLLSFWLILPLFQFFSLKCRTHWGRVPDCRRLNQAGFEDHYFLLVNWPQNRSHSKTTFARVTKKQPKKTKTWQVSYGAASMQMAPYTAHSAFWKTNKKNYQNNLKHIYIRQLVPYIVRYKTNNKKKTKQRRWGLKTTGIRCGQGTSNNPCRTGSMLSISNIPLSHPTARSLVSVSQRTLVRYIPKAVHNSNMNKYILTSTCTLKSDIHSTRGWCSRCLQSFCACWN